MNAGEVATPRSCLFLAIFVLPSPFFAGCTPPFNGSASNKTTSRVDLLTKRRIAIAEALADVMRIEMVVWTIPDDRVGDLRIGPVIVEDQESIGRIVEALSEIQQVALSNPPFAKYNDVNEVEMVLVTHHGPDFKVRMSGGSTLHLFADELISAEASDRRLHEACVSLAKGWQEKHPKDAIVYGGRITE